MMKHYNLTTLKTLIFVFLSMTITSSVTAGAKYLECGKSYWYGASTHNHYTKSNYNMGSCTQTNLWYDGADQLFYFDIDGTKDVTIKLSGLHGDLDMFLFKKYNEWGRQQFNDCVGSSVRGNHLDETITMNGASGRYYLVVDAYKWGVHSGYDIEITCKDKPKPPTKALCTDLPTLHCGDHKVVGGYYSNWMKTTDVVDSHPECSSGYGWHAKDYSGPEHIYKLSGYYGSLSNVTIDVHSLEHGTDLEVFVYKHCEMWRDPWTGHWETKFSGLVNKCDGYGNSYNWQYSSNKSVHIGHIGYHDELYVVVESKSSGWNSGIGKYEIAVSCGDVCDQQMDPIECNTKVKGKTSNRRNKASYYQQNSYSASAANWGPEMTYELKVDYEMELELDLHIYSNADLNMYLMNACDPYRCVASSVKYGRKQHENLKHKVRPGTYYVVIEGYHGDHGNYELEVSGCKCANAQELYCDRAVRSSTHNAPNNLDQIRNDCFSSYGGVWLKGKDRTYSFKAPKAGTYEFTLTGLSKDLDLFLMDDCNDENTCRGYSTKTSNRDESVTIELRKHEEIFAHVDSRSTNVTSNFTIKVDCSPTAPDPEPDPDPTPDPEPDPDPAEPSGHCYSFTRAGNVISLDLSGAELTTCDSASITLMAIPLDADGNPDMTAIQMIDIVDGVATFDPGVNAEGTDYRICYEESCDGVIKSCCQEFAYDEVINLACGDTYEGTTKGKSSSFSASDIEDCYSSSSSFTGPDQLVPFTKSDDAPISLTMFQDDANLSLFVVDASGTPVSTDCKGDNFNATKDLVNGASVGEYWTDAADPLPAGTYYMLIEGFAKTVASDFTLDISCGLDCSVADTISVGDTFEDEANDASNGGSAYHIAESLKVGYTGGERVYALTVSDASTVTITVSDINGVDADLDIFLLGDACDDQSVIEQSITAGDADESMTATLAAGTYYIVVDGWRGTSATYDIAVVEGEGVTSGIVAAGRSVNSAISHSAYPNPFARDLFIDLTVNEATTATIEMISVDGRTLYNNQATLTAGANRVRIAGDVLNASGVMYYRINTGTEVVQGKVMKMN